ncbi:MAG: fumarylacetoacetate hydrolase family protein [Phycisphaeraceae bacterium]|nr:fumarylacetoacetate hydrolase family protein [Phycisphaeraceae bacterium]MCW5754272.1 fumarylacetoacetate hydrolase family protein [Phycisphaeraceae bacterium]
MQIIRSGHGLAVWTPTGVLPLAYIIGIGRNYADHATEQGADIPERPMVFTKSPASACLHEEAIVIPRVCQDREQVDFEAELAVILSNSARDVPVERALDQVLGYACANDVSARWWQKSGSGGQFCRGKSFDTFCPIGPRVVPAADVGDPQRLRIVCRVNDRVMQDASTGQMIFSVAALIAELSRGATLPAGTVILTGTPGGVGMARDPQVFLKAGDVVEVEIERVGRLRNRVTRES